jgi:hypothetical protein
VGARLMVVSRRSEVVYCGCDTEHKASLTAIYEPQHTRLQDVMFMFIIWYASMGCESRVYTLRIRKAHARDCFLSATLCKIWDRKLVKAQIVSDVV